MRRAALAAVAAAALGAAAPAGAVNGQGGGPRADRGERPFLDVRAERREAVRRRGDESLRRPGDATRAGRARLRRALGRQAVVAVDPLTGTPRALARLDGTLTGPARGGAVDVAARFVRAQLPVLGLTAGDLGSLRLASRSTTPGGVEVVRWRQYADGIPALDSELRVNVLPDGRVLSVIGAPQHALALPDGPQPRLDAAAALRRLMEDVGARRRLAVVSGPAGARRETVFEGGDRARLVVFGEGTRARLAWQLTYRASPGAWYDAVVDAAGGEVLRRANLVKHAAPAQVFDHYPGAPAGGEAGPVDLEPWLSAPDEDRLFGPNAHAWSDLNDDVDDAPEPSEEIRRNPATGDFTYPFDEFTPAENPDGACADDARCSWDAGVAGSWAANRQQNAVQAFALVNRFHEHLEAPPIGFDAGDGHFEGADRVLVQTDDGAALGPDDAHVDNANFATPPDGRSPVMQLYLWHASGSAGFRDVNAGDDAAILYHEYAHGLSNRLVTLADGSGALNSPQSGAMGEGWSDFYAKDFLVAPPRAFEVDSPEPGEISMGAYVDATANRLRTQPLDCPVGTHPRCPGTDRAGAGGYTYGDFARVHGGPQVHGDGEIWGETLWDLRSALGGVLARQLVTEAMRLSPPEPSFLDMRNAILQADTALHGGSHHNRIWGVFARRGMGFFAGAADGSDIAPAESFALPPAADAPRGSVAGRVTDGITGLPLAGVRVAPGGLDSGPGGFTATTGADGRYGLGGLPAGGYPKLVFGGAAGFDRTTMPVTVPAGGTALVDAVLRRNWAARAGGASAVRTNGNEYAEFGCGVTMVHDQAPGTGWSADNPTRGDNSLVSGVDKHVVLALPQRIDIDRFGLHPGPACGDDPSAATRSYRIETSGTGPDGPWTVARDGTIASGDVGRTTEVAPAGGAQGVRFVRLTLIAAQDERPGRSGFGYIDFSELSVYGGPPNAPPVASLTATPGRAAIGEPVRLDAAGSSDADSVIAGYDWDFDGDGTVDRTTAEPATAFAYGAPGRFTPRVGVRDVRGGVGAASAVVEVAGPPAPPPPAPPPGAAVAGLPPEARLPRTGRRGRLVVRVRCDSACTGTVRLTVDRRTARRLRLGSSRTVGLARVRLPAAGERRVTVRLTRRSRRGLIRADRRTLKGRVSVRVLDAERQRLTARRTVRVRR